MRVVTVELSTSAGWRGGADTAAPARPAGTCLHGGWWGCPGCRHGAERPPTRAEPDEVPADEHGHVERAVGRGIQCDVMGAQRLLQARLPLPPAEGSQDSLGRGPEPPSPTTPPAAARRALPSSLVLPGEQWTDKQHEGPWAALSISSAGPRPVLSRYPGGLETPAAARGVGCPCAPLSLQAPAVLPGRCGPWTPLRGRA